jgi:hypothetical protein
MNYKQFIASKKILAVPTGFEPGPLPNIAYSTSNRIASTWGCRRGRAAFFEDCGLGKTPQQLAWAEQVCTNVRTSRS